MVSVNALLKMTMDLNASDLHITADSPPVLRIDGKLTITDLAVLGADDSKQVIYSILNDEQKAMLEQDRELDFSFSLPEMDRYRVNVHYQKGKVEAAFRRIPKKIPNFEDLGVPDIAYELIRKSNGLVLVTGPTGMGKSTTLATMVDLINIETQQIIISIEDPIEFYHGNKKSIIKQREIYSDTHSFPEALRRALRQDPDVIIVGEMRDLETISTTLTAAETGHLVLATLHTPDAPQTVQRIIDVFSPHQQKQVRIQLADALRGVISQILLPRAEGKGRVLATEVLVATPGIRNLIREGEVAQIPSLLQMGAQYGMHTMDKCLKDLYRRGIITRDVAISKVKNISEFESL
ncbi:MAG: type IV pilus twitching motility protein PilT [Candidatus Omnitrophica bacterium]|nr:type IV pilus twitching motility protein PilT [Candidatus Omnitrophota bacterium]